MDNERREYTFFWYIENYSYCWHEKGQKLVSPNFLIEKLEGTGWSLEFYPRGKVSDINAYNFALSLCRNRHDDGPRSIYVDTEIAIIGADESDILCAEHNYSFQRDTGHTIVGNFPTLEKIFMRENSDYLPQDTLTIRCKIRKGRGRFCNIGQSSARSCIKIETNSFRHVVEDFSSLQLLGVQEKEIQSHFKKGRLIKSNLYFSGDDISIEIQIFDTVARPNHLFCTCELYLLDRFGNLIECGTFDNRYDAAKQCYYTIPVSLKRKEILNRRSEYLRNDRFTIICKCIFSYGIKFRGIEETLNDIPSFVIRKIGDCGPRKASENLSAVANTSGNVDVSEKQIHEVAEKLSGCVSISEDINVPKKHICEAAEKLSTCRSVSEDIKALYANQCLNDVELKTGTKSFPAHKIILCARSSVFRAMFTNDMKEKNTNCIHIDDLKDDVVQQLLLFLYTDVIENLQWENAAQLFYAADKYEISRLKEICSLFLAENITTDTAGELLHLADTHNDDNLKKLAEDFILKHHEQVFGSKEWYKVAEKNPLLCVKAMQLKYKRNNDVN